MGIKPTGEYGGCRAVVGCSGIASGRCECDPVALEQREPEHRPFQRLDAGNHVALSFVSTARRVSWIVLSALFLLTAGFPCLTMAAELPEIRWGGDIRLRAEAMDNARDLDDSKHDSYGYYRMKYGIWADARPRDWLRIFLRLGNEYRWGSYAGSIRGDGVYDMASVRDQESRASLDNGFAEIRLADSLSFSFGRMDMIYGEGFLLFDGTPADGGASLYFDVAKLTLRRGPAVVDLFTAKIQDEGFGTAAKDEDLYGLYVRRDRADVYVLSRNKRGTTHSLSGVVHPKQSTTALGALYAHTPESGIHIAAQGAVQYGRYRRFISAGDQEGAGVVKYRNGAARLSMAADSWTHLSAEECEFVEADRKAYGGYIRSGWTAASRPGIGFELGGVVLSGDDPSTRENEGWDGFYSEWSTYSELYIYTIYDNTSLVRTEVDGRVALDDEGSWTNLAAAWAEVRLPATGRFRAAARATYLGAIEKTGTGRGRERGILFMAKADAVPASGLTLQILGERFDPGDFYWSGASIAWYGRAQITARF